MTKVTVELSVEMELDDDPVDWKVWKGAYERICDGEYTLEGMYINGRPLTDF